MALKNLDLASESFKEAREEFINSLSLDERFLGLTPEQVLARYTPEQVLARYTPEQRLIGLTPEELLELARKLKQ